jgi:hypothetical protein
MAILCHQCEVIASGNVAAKPVKPPSARRQALQRGGGDTTSNTCDSSERLTI